MTLERFPPRQQHTDQKQTLQLVEWSWTRLQWFLHYFWILEVCSQWFVVFGGQQMPRWHWPVNSVNHSSTSALTFYWLRIKCVRVLQVSGLWRLYRQTPWLRSPQINTHAHTTLPLRPPASPHLLLYVECLDTQCLRWRDVENEKKNN